GSGHSGKANDMVSHHYRSLEFRLTASSQQRRVKGADRLDACIRRRRDLAQSAAVNIQLSVCWTVVSLMRCSWLDHRSGCIVDAAKQRLEWSPFRRTHRRLVARPATSHNLSIISTPCWTSRE